MWQKAPGDVESLWARCNEPRRARKFQAACGCIGPGAMRVRAGGYVGLGLQVWPRGLNQTSPGPNLHTRPRQVTVGPGRGAQIRFAMFAEAMAGPRLMDIRPGWLYGVWL